MKHLAYIAAAFMALALAAGAAATSYTDRPVRAAGAAATHRDLAPDDRSRHLPGPVSGARSLDIAPDDRVLHRPGSDVPIVPVVSTATGGNSFDWVDASIGAAGMAGLMLLGLGSTLVLRRRQAAAFS